MNCSFACLSQLGCITHLSRGRQSDRFRLFRCFFRLLQINQDKHKKPKWFIEFTLICVYSLKRKIVCSLGGLQNHAYIWITTMTAGQDTLEDIFSFSFLKNQTVQHYKIQSKLFLWVQTIFHSTLIWITLFRQNIYGGEWKRILAKLTFPLLQWSSIMMSGATA